jgi:hypothetical protein
MLFASLFAGIVLIATIITRPVLEEREDVADAA